MHQRMRNNAVDSGDRFVCLREKRLTQFIVSLSRRQNSRNLLQRKGIGANVYFRTRSHRLQRRGSATEPLRKCNVSDTLGNSENAAYALHENSVDTG